MGGNRGCYRRFQAVDSSTACAGVTFPRVREAGSARELRTAHIETTYKV